MKWSGSLNFRGAQQAILRGVEAGVEESADDILADALALVPKDTGELRASAEVSMENGVAAISFGTDHAIYQHERLDYNHPGGGQAKFLEKPLSAAQKTVGAKVSARVKRELS